MYVYIYSNGTRVFRGTRGTRVYIYSNTFAFFKKVSVTGTFFHWSAIGAVLLTCLFQGRLFALFISLPFPRFYMV